MHSSNEKWIKLLLLLGDKRKNVERDNLTYGMVEMHIKQTTVYFGHMSIWWGDKKEMNGILTHTKGKQRIFLAPPSYSLKHRRMYVCHTIYLWLKAPASALLTNTPNLLETLFVWNELQNHFLNAIAIITS